MSLFAYQALRKIVWKIVNSSVASNSNKYTCAVL